MARMDLASLSRLIENLLRIGTVEEVDHTAARCRVRTGGNLTEWLPWFAHRAGHTRTWTPPTPGEQVLLLSPSGELAAGLVLVGLYSTANPSPSANANNHVIDFPDGATISYNHDTGALIASGIQTAVIEASLSVTLDTPLVHCTDQLVVDGLLTYKNGIAGTGGDNNNIITGNFIQTDGQLSSNGVVLETHVHPENDSGGPTGQPIGGGS